MTILHHRRYHHVDDLIGTPQEMKSGFTHFSSRRFIGMRGGGASGSKENSSSGKSAPATAAAKKSTPAPEAPPPPRPTLTIVTELESGSDKDETWVNNNSILSMATSVPNPAYGGVLGASVPANTASILNCPNSEPSMPRLSATPIVPIAPIAEADQRMKVLQQLESKFGQDGKKPLPAASTAKHSAGASPAASSPSKSGADSTASKGGVLTSTIDTKKGAEKEKKSSGPKTVAQMRRERREQVLRVGVQRLQKRLGDLHLHLHNVRHDGNCQFRSIAYQLLGSEHYHDCIRSHVASYMRSRREKFDFYFDTKEKADAYYTGVAKGGTWGDELTLRAASDSLCLNIHVISSEEHHCYITYRPSPDAPPPPSFLVDMQSIQERHRAERKSQHLDAASPIFDATAIQQALQQRLTEADIFSTTPHFAAEGTAVQPAAEGNAEQAGNHMAKFVAAGAEVGGDSIVGGPEINNIIRRPVLPTVPSSNNTSSRAGRYGGPLFTANEGHVTLLASSYKSGSKSLRQSFAGLPSHCLDGASTSGVTANSFYNSSFSLAPGDCVAADGGSGPMTPSCGLNPIAMSSSVTGASEADLSGISGGAGTRFLFEARSEPVDVFLSYLCPVQYNAVVVEEFEDVLEAAQNQQQPSPGATVTPPHGITPVGSSPRLATSAMAGPSPGQFVSVPFLRPPGNDSTSLET